MSDLCKNYSVELLDLCQSTEEIVSILDEGSDAEDEPTEEVPPTAKVNHSLARVKLALKYEQKRVSDALSQCPIFAQYTRNHPHIDG